MFNISDIASVLKVTVSLALICEQISLKLLYFQLNFFEDSKSTISKKIQVISKSLVHHFEALEIL